MTTNMNTLNDTYDDSLLSLLPSTPFLLAYSLPLLLLSLLLTFSGAFLTLDRSRSFPPHIAQKHPSYSSPTTTIAVLSRQLLLSGVGGWATGYVFAVHTVTFLATLIPSITPSSPLNSKSFLATWLLSAILCASLAGRWRYLTFALAGITGSGTFALAISIICHPSLLSRQILAAIFIPLGTILCLVPIPKFSHTPLRIASAASGAFGIVVSIALLAHIISWGNVWQHFWATNSVDWSTGKEKALSATYCVLFPLGIFCDWLLHRYIGANPDQDWDGYLARYSQNFSDTHNRAGSFAPLPSFWDRLKGIRVHQKPQLVHTFDDELDSKVPPSLLPSFKLLDGAPVGPPVAATKGTFPNTTAFLAKGRRGKRGFRHGKPRAVVKFKASLDDLSDGESKSDEDETLYSSRSESATRSASTLVPLNDTTVPGSILVSHTSSIERDQPSPLVKEICQGSQEANVHWDHFWKDVRHKAVS